MESGIVLRDFLARGSPKGVDMSKRAALEYPCVAIEFEEVRRQGEATWRGSVSCTLIDPYFTVGFDVKFTDGVSIFYRRLDFNGKCRRLREHREVNYAQDFYLRKWRIAEFTHICDACVAWILCAKRIKCFPKDMIRFIAHAIWETRYDVAWNPLLFKKWKGLARENAKKRYLPS